MQLKRQIHKNNKSKTIFFYLIIWFISIVLTSIWTFENPDKIELIKNIYKKKAAPISRKVNTESIKIEANSFFIEYEKVISLTQKTSFILYDNNTKSFNPEFLKIYTQYGYLISGLKNKKIKLPESFTLQRNGGVKTIFINDKNKFALISNNKGKCFYASLVELTQGNEILKSKCLPDDKKKADFNGLGSSNVHIDDNIYFDTPGNALRYLKIFNDLNVESSNDKISCIFSLIEKFKVKKDPYLLTLISPLVELFYNDLALKNNKKLNIYFYNKSKVLKQINDTKNFNLDINNLLISLKEILQNEK